MREMGLYVASGKTKIKSSEEVIKELAKGRNQISEIEAHIASKQPERIEQAVHLLKDFFLELVNDSQKFNDRQFRFCVNRFKRLYVTGVGKDVQERVISEVLQRLISMPESTDVFVDYLSLFPDHEEIQRVVIDFLDGPYNIYAWQEMLLLELLIRSNLKDDLRTRANQFASGILDAGKHPACKTKAYVLCGKNGTYADRRDIRSKFVHEEREDVKRSIVVAIQEMRADERNHFYQSISKEARGIGQITEYIQSLPKPTYYYYNPPNPYDVLLPDDSDDLYELGSEYFV
jgi:hypothetical protein